MSASEAHFAPRSPRHLITSLFPSLPTARGLEHHRALGQGQLPGDPAGGHIPLPHLALLLRLRQRRFQKLQQQRDPGELSWHSRKEGRTSWPVLSLASVALGQLGRGLALAWQTVLAPNGESFIGKKFWKGRLPPGAGGAAAPPRNLRGSDMSLGSRGDVNP